MSFISDRLIIYSYLNSHNPSIAEAVNAPELYILFILYIWLLSFPLLAQAEDSEIENTDSVSSAIMQGKSLSQARLRYEYVNEENKPQDANAFTLRTLVGWQTAAVHHLSLGLQAVNVKHLNNDFYDNYMHRDQTSRFPTVADSEITDVNQLFFDYTGISHNHLRLGRQIVRLDNARFLGESPFRQIPQVFDGFTLRNQTLQDTKFFLGHYNHLRQYSANYREANIDVLHLAYQYLPRASVVSYGYFIGLSNTGQNTGASNNAHKDFGIRFDGAVDINETWHWLHTFEFAKQTAYQGGSPMINASYSKLVLGLEYVDFYVRLDQERLSSNHGIYAFQTPLAPLHSFQGWTDLFTTTPQQGMVDRFLSMEANWQSWSMQSQLHAFYSDIAFQSPTGHGSHYGNELDMSLAYQWPRKFQTKFEYASFREAEIDGVSTQSATRKRNTTKAWITFLYTF